MAAGLVPEPPEPSPRRRPNGLTPEKPAGVALLVAAFPADARWVEAVRVVARLALKDHPSYDPDLVELLVSELTSNAIRHSRSAAFSLVMIRLENGNLWVSVMDQGRGNSIPRMRPGALLDEGGRGLRLVNHYAERWGVERDHGRVSVWFEIGTRAETAKRAEKSWIDDAGEIEDAERTMVPVPDNARPAESPATLADWRGGGD